MAIVTSELVSNIPQSTMLSCLDSSPAIKQRHTGWWSPPGRPSQAPERCQGPCQAPLQRCARRSPPLSPSCPCTVTDHGCGMLSLSFSGALCLGVCTNHSTQLRRSSKHHCFPQCGISPSTFAALTSAWEHGTTPQPSRPVYCRRRCFALERMPRPRELQSLATS